MILDLTARSFFATDACQITKKTHAHTKRGGIISMFEYKSIVYTFYLAFNWLPESLITRKDREPIHKWCTYH